MRPETKVGRLFQPAVMPERLRSLVRDYVRLFDEGDATARKQQSAELTRTYYNVVTDFYEHGWGQSFHFAPLGPNESFAAAIARHEQYLALRLGLGATQRVLDLGCGVGGPMRSIARFSRATVVGINNNDYQIARGNKLNQEEHLADRCSFIASDFTNVPLPERSFDAAYVIEAACHAGDRRLVFAEALRLLKPGSLFAGYEWCLTNRYDDVSIEHRQIRHDIEKGNALPDLVSTEDVDSMLREVGFEVIETFDAALLPTTAPWYQPLEARVSLQGFLHSRAGIFFTHQIVRALELTHLSPPGAVEAHNVLRTAQRSLVAGGRAGIFTPMYFFLARKP